MEGSVIGLMIVVLIISITVYGFKVAPQVYRFIKKKRVISQEKKKIMIQNFLLETRGAELLAAGYTVKRDISFGLHFVKEGKELILEDQLRGWSDDLFNKTLYGSVQEK